MFPSLSFPGALAPNISCGYPLLILIWFISPYPLTTDSSLQDDKVIRPKLKHLVTGYLARPGPQATTLVGRSAQASTEPCPLSPSLPFTHACHQSWVSNVCRYTPGEKDPRVFKWSHWTTDWPTTHRDLKYLLCHLGQNYLKLCQVFKCIMKPTANNAFSSFYLRNS